MSWIAPVLAVAGNAGVQRRASAHAHIEHFDAAIVAAHSHQAGVLWVPVQAHYPCTAAAAVTAEQEQHEAGCSADSIQHACMYL